MFVCTCVILKSSPITLKTKEKLLKKLKPEKITAELGREDKAEFIDYLLSTGHFCMLFHLIPVTALKTGGMSPIFYVSRMSFRAIK